MMWRKLINPFVCVLLAILYFVDIGTNAFTFLFVHANVFHLCGNMIAITVINDNNFSAKRNAIMFISGYVACVLSYLAFGNNVVGFSSMIFYLWGFRFIYDCISLTSKSVFKYFAGLCFTFAVSLVVPSIAFWMHFIPFIAGSITGSVFFVVDAYKKDMYGCK